MSTMQDPFARDRLDPLNHVLKETSRRVVFRRVPIKKGYIDLISTFFLIRACFESCIGAPARQVPTLLCV